VSLDRLVEEMIRAAMERGEFDNLPGKGKPLDLDAYFALPEEERVALQMLKDAGFVPAEVQLLRDINELRQALGAAAGEADRARLQKALEEKTLAFNVTMDRRRARKSGRNG
jgi:hypothetical protein